MGRLSYTVFDPAVFVFAFAAGAEAFDGVSAGNMKRL